MKKNHLSIGAVCSVWALLATGCNNGKGAAWDDDKTTGHYNPATSLWSNHTANNDELLEPNREDFVSLKDDDLKPRLADGAVPQPKNSPGEPGSGLPGLEGFHTPAGLEAAIFSTLYFNTDDHILRDPDYLAAIDKVAFYLKSHPDLYLFISGNADERGPEGYNLSLGSRRANYIRTKLVEKGVNPDRMHTVSYGKERPIDLGHNQQAWAKNRRVEFKIYQKS